jgi:hypothetical protein
MSSADLPATNTTVLQRKCTYVVYRLMIGYIIVVETVLLLLANHLVGQLVSHLPISRTVFSFLPLS